MTFTELLTLFHEFGHGLQVGFPDRPFTRLYLLTPGVACVVALTICL
jgi:hypothetical protein